MDALPYNARLVEREDVSDQHAILRVRHDDGPPPDFEPGQHTALGLMVEPSEDELAARKGRARLARRSYSIASAPRQRDYLEFYIVRVPTGRFSALLWELQPGDPLFMDRRVAGHLTLGGVPREADVVCIATGTGVAPFVSMVRTYRGEGRWRKLVLLHGTRLASELGYRGELERVAAEDPSVVYLPTLTREPPGSEWLGLRGRIHQVLDASAFAKLTGVGLTPESCHVFLCGNPAMVDECEEAFMQRGFVVRDHRNPGGNIHFERFW